MKKGFSVIVASVILTSCFSSPIGVSALSQNSDDNSSVVLDEKTISDLIDWGVDAHLLEAAMSAQNNRGISTNEYVIAYYTTQAAPVLQSSVNIAHLTTLAYCSSNLEPYYFHPPYLTDPNAQTSYVNHHFSVDIINEEFMNYGMDHFSAYETEFLYLGSSDWVAAGLFKKTGTGNVTLGQDPVAYSSPIQEFYLTDTVNHNNDINCANPSYETTLLGDINLDGDVDISDAVAVYQIGNSSTKKQKLAADVNLDHNYDAYDANLILSFVAHNISSFFDNAVLYYAVDNVGGDASI